MQGAADRLDETMRALAEFSFYEGELRKLEQEIGAAWPAAEADAALTHGVDAAAVRRWPYINRMTEEVTFRRMRYARLERRLEKPSIALPGPARRLVSELLVQAEIPDRLKSVDERLEVFEDLYELANDRISEFAYFRREYRLELWIILLLLAEVVLMLWDLLA